MKPVAGWVIPALLLLGSGLVAWVLVGNGDSGEPEPLRVEASGTRFSSVEEMAAAADRVVEGRVVLVDEGRSITAPEDPDRGVVTQLLQVETGDGESIVVEQEAALLDGTPITVNGLPAGRQGDEGFWFLVQGRSNEFPYTALVNEQARLVVVNGVPRTVVADAALDAELAELGVDGLRRLLK